MMSSQQTAFKCTCSNKSETSKGMSCVQAQGPADAMTLLMQ